MPLYEYQCENGHKFERYLPLSMADKVMYCEEDDLPAEKLWSAPAFPSHGLPTRIFRNPRNPSDIRVAIYKGQKTPEGYVEQELKTPMERTKVEKEMQKNADAENEYATEKRKFITDHTRKNRHSDLNARMATLTKNSDNPSAAESLLRAGMNRSKKKKTPPKKTEFHFAVNHKDKSNLDKG